MKDFRVGEQGYNNFGSLMIIKEYRKATDIDIYFPQYDYVVKNQRYSCFKNKEIRCPYERRTYGVGFIGVGEYKTNENLKRDSTWREMIRRCYNDKKQKQFPSYKKCSVCNDWHNYQNFAKWYDENYYEIDGETMCLDKDILIKGNKVYSPTTCIFVTNRINTLIIGSNASRGGYPKGVSYHKKEKKFYSRCRNGMETITLGTYDTSLEAFEKYNDYKEKLIQKIAKEVKIVIPQQLFNAMMNYTVEIDD